MSELEGVEVVDTGGTVWDAPNQQVVRHDNSAPWDEGSGASGPGEPKEKSLDEMTKDELLAYAQEHGVSPANASMTKDEIRASINEAGAG